MAKVIWTHILARSNGLIDLLMVDLQTCNFLLHKMLTDGLEWCGSLWIIVMFLSAVWTLILMAPIHCRGSIGEQVMYNSPEICSDEETNSSP